MARAISQKGRGNQSVVLATLARIRRYLVKVKRPIDVDGVLLILVGDGRNHTVLLHRRKKNVHFFSSFFLLSLSAMAESKEALAARLAALRARREVCVAAPPGPSHSFVFAFCLTGCATEEPERDRGRGSQSEAAGQL